MSKLIPIDEYIEENTGGNQSAFADSLLSYKSKKVSRQGLRDWRQAAAPLYVIEGKVVRLVAEIIN